MQLNGFLIAGPSPRHVFLVTGVVLFSQALQVGRAAALLPDAHASTLVPVGRVPDSGLLRARPHALRLGAQCYLAG